MRRRRTSRRRGLASAIALAALGHLLALLALGWRIPTVSQKTEVELVPPIEVELLRPTVRVVIALGAFAWTAAWPTLAAVYGVAAPTPRPTFGHGVRVQVPGLPMVLGCYHVSQQNTFTGRLTPAMLDDVLGAARAAAGLAG